MVQPNSTCVDFCEFCLTSGLRFTTTRRNYIQAIADAGIAVIPVTQAQWYQFLLITGFAYPLWQASAEFS